MSHQESPLITLCGYDQNVCVVALDPMIKSQEPRTDALAILIRCRGIPGTLAAPGLSSNTARRM